MMLLDWLSNRVRKGCSPEFTEEEYRRAIVINWFAIIGSMIPGALGLRAYIVADYPLAISLLAAAVVFIIIRITMVIGRSSRTHKVASAMLISSLMILMVYLVISGGKAHTGPLWMLILPPVTLFLNGLRRGIFMLAGFLVVVGYLLFASDMTFIDQTYSLEFKKRLVYVFFTMIYLSGVYEYSRQKTYTEIQTLREKFEYQATYDPLTQMLNRRGMKQSVTTELARAERQSSVTSVILMDLDRFKSVNDTYGHDAGDDVLKATADLIQQTIRQQDLVARWGGEEFLLVLPDTQQDNAVVLAEKIRHAIAETNIPTGKHSINITASFGVSQTLESNGFEKAISLADKALYCAKSDGRNRVELAQKEPQTHT